MALRVLYLSAFVCGWLGKASATVSGLHNENATIGIQQNADKIYNTKQTNIVNKFFDDDHIAGVQVLYRFTKRSPGPSAPNAFGEVSWDGETTSMHCTLSAIPFDVKLLSDAQQSNLNLSYNNFSCSSGGGDEFMDQGKWAVVLLSKAFHIDTTLDVHLKVEFTLTYGGASEEDQWLSDPTSALRRHGYIFVDGMELVDTDHAWLPYAKEVDLGYVADVPCMLSQSPWNGLCFPPGVFNKQGHAQVDTIACPDEHTSKTCQKETIESCKDSCKESREESFKEIDVDQTPDAAHYFRHQQYYNCLWNKEYAIDTSKSWQTSYFSFNRSSLVKDLEAEKKKDDRTISENTKKTCQEQEIERCKETCRLHQSFLVDPELDPDNDTRKVRYFSSVGPKGRLASLYDRHWASVYGVTWKHKPVIDASCRRCDYHPSWLQPAACKVSKGRRERGVGYKRLRMHNGSSGSLHFDVTDLVRAGFRAFRIHAVPRQRELYATERRQSYSHGLSRRLMGYYSGTDIWPNITVRTWKFLNAGYQDDLKRSYAV